MDIDLALKRLGGMPVPVELAAIDQAVFAGVRQRRRDAITTTRLMGVTAAFALVAGLADGGMAASALNGDETPPLFASANALAPAALLDIHP